MKRIILFTFLIAGFSAFGQIKTPSASPKVSTTQEFGLGEITIEYSRPSVKDRVIFSDDGLVPLGKKWRLGANQATKMTFSEDVMIEGKALEAGTYAVIATPSLMSWDIEFHNHDTGSWSKYVDRTPAVTVTGKVNKMGMSCETFTIVTDNHRDSSADLNFLWDKSMVTLGMTTKVDDAVMEAISATMAGPTAYEKYQAATYYHKNGKDMSKALSWINEATAGDDPKFWQVRRKALILADMGKKKEAIKAATLSMELAEKAGNDEYVKMNKASIKEWSM